MPSPKTHDEEWSDEFDRLERRVFELEAALRSYADAIERVYGELPASQYPGPPTSIVANMRSAAKGRQ